MFLLGSVSLASAGECTMKPAPIDVHRIAREPAIKSYVVDSKNLALTALLKNGSAMRLLQMGCEHSGASVSLWFDSKLDPSYSKAWAKEIGTVVRIAFAPAVANDIIKNLGSGDVEITTTESGFRIGARPNDFMSYSIVVSSTEQGDLLTVSYSFG